MLNDPTAFFRFVTNETPTKYQEAILKDESKQITIRASRQSGKSEVTAVKVLWTAITNSNSQILLTAPTMRQASIIRNKMNAFMLRTPLMQFTINYSQSYIKFKNGSEIYSLPGTNPETVRGFSPDLLVIDEAAYVKDRVYSALEPSMAQTNGSTMLISSPYGKKGRFYDSHTKLDYYSKYHIPWSDCPFISREYIEKERQSKTEMEFKQEYEAEFLDNSDALISLDLIKEAVADINPEKKAVEGRDYYLGVDQARYGTDETVYIVVAHKPVKIFEEEKLIESYDDIKVVYWDSTAKNNMTDVMGRTQALHSIFNFKKIYMDSSSIGSGPSDFLKEANLPIEFNGFTQKEKHNMFTSLVLLFEKNKQRNLKKDEGVNLFDSVHFKIPDIQKLLWQLGELEYEYSSNSLMKIHHPDKSNAHDDWPDALALACSFMMRMRFIVDST